MASKFFHSLKSLFGSESYLGIDIGTTSIKLAEISRAGLAGNRPALKNYGILETYGHLERINDAIQTPSLKMFEGTTVELLKILLRNTRVKSKEAVASLPAFSSFVTLLEIPLMPKDEVEKTMYYQARQYIPLPLSEVSLDWTIVGERDTPEGLKRQQVLLISVPTEIIKKYQNIFAAAGLNLIALELETISSARILVGNEPVLTLILDIGARSTSISIVERGLLKTMSVFDIGGANLTQAIANGLGINVRRAEDLKKTRGLEVVGAEADLPTLLFPFIDVMINEVRRVRDLFERSYGRRPERLILSGGEANLPGLRKYIEEQLSLPVLKADPFSKINYPDKLEPLVGELGPLLAIALGLSIREVI